LKRWLLAMSMALNQLANTILGGDPDMSVSARAGLAREHGARGGRIACHLLDWIDPHDGDRPIGDHCTIAVRNHKEQP
jgi:hypothetical protein